MSEWRELWDVGDWMTPGDFEITGSVEGWKVADQAKLRSKLMSMMLNNGQCKTP